MNQAQPAQLHLASDRAFETRSTSGNLLAAIKLNNHETAREYTEGCVFRICREPPGAPLKYGDEVYLQHTHTGQYVTWQQCLAPYDRTCLQVVLLPEPRAESLFRVQPRYNFRVEGDKVRVDDPITLVALDTGLGDHYLHATCEDMDADDWQSVRFEVNIGPVASVWRPHVFRSFRTAHQVNTLQGGDIVRLFHRELNAELTVSPSGSYLVPPGRRIPSWQHDSLNTKPKLRREKSNEMLGVAASFLHEGKVAADEVAYSPMLQSTQARDSWSLWLIEREQANLGEVLGWADVLRFKSIGSGEYLCLSVDRSTWSTTPDKTKDTLFLLRPTHLASRRIPPTVARERERAPSFKPRVHRTPSVPHRRMSRTLSIDSAAPTPVAPTTASVAAPTEFNTIIMNNSRARLQHVASGMWLCGDTDHEAPLRRVPSVQGRGSLFKDEVFLSVPVHAHQQRQEKDVFELQKVMGAEVDNFYIVWSRKPVLIDFALRIRADTITLRSTNECKRVLEELGRFCTHSETRDIMSRRGAAVPAHQSLLQGQRVIDVVVDIVEGAYCLFLQLQSTLASLRPPTDTTSPEQASPEFPFGWDTAASRHGDFDDDREPLPNLIVCKSTTGEPISRPRFTDDGQLRDVANAETDTSDDELFSDDDGDGDGDDTHPRLASVNSNRSQSDERAQLLRCLETLHYISVIQPLAYSLLRLFVWGNREGQLYLANMPSPRRANTSVLESLRDHLYLPQGIGEMALFVVRYIYKDNPTLLSSVTARHIYEPFALPHSLQVRVPDFLSVFCVGEGDKGMESNQLMLTRAIMDTPFLSRSDERAKQADALVRSIETQDSTNVPDFRADLSHMGALAPLEELEARPVDEWYNAFLPRLRLHEGVVQWDPHLDGSWMDLETFYGTTLDKGGKTRQACTHLRTTLWLFRALCLDNPLTIRIFRSLLPKQTLLCMLSMQLPSNFRRNVAELLTLLWVDSRAKQRRARLRMIIRFEEKDDREEDVQISDDSQSDDDDHVEVVVTPGELQIEPLPSPKKAPESTAADDRVWLKGVCDFVFQFLNNASVLLPGEWDEVNFGKLYMAQHWDIVLAQSVLKLVRHLVLLGYLDRHGVEHVVQLLRNMLRASTPMSRRHLVRSERNTAIVAAKHEVCSIIELVAQMYINEYATDVLQLGSTNRVFAFGALPLRSISHFRRSLLASEMLSSAGKSGLWDVLPTDHGSHHPDRRLTVTSKQCVSMKSPLTMVSALVRSFGLEDSLAPVGRKFRKRHSRLISSASVIFNEQLHNDLLDLFMYGDGELQELVARLLVYLHRPAAELSKLLTRIVVVSPEHTMLSSHGLRNLNSELLPTLVGTPMELADESEPTARSASLAISRQQLEESMAAHRLQEEAQQSQAEDHTSMHFFYTNFVEHVGALADAADRMGMGQVTWEQVLMHLRAIVALCDRVRSGFREQVQTLMRNIGLHTTIHHVLTLLVRIISARSALEPTDDEDERHWGKVGAGALMNLVSPTHASQFQRVGTTKETADSSDGAFAFKPDSVNELAEHLVSHLPSADDELLDNLVVATFDLTYFFCKLSSTNQRSISTQRFVDLVVTVLRLSTRPATAKVVARSIMACARGNPAVCNLFGYNHLEQIVASFSEHEHWIFLRILQVLIRPTISMPPSREKQTAAFDLLLVNNGRLLELIDELVAEVKVLRRSRSSESPSRKRWMRPGRRSPLHHRSLQMGILELLSLCAQGRNRVVEVKCQDLVPVRTLLHVLACTGNVVSFRTKTIVLRFYHEVHVYTAPESDTHPLRDRNAGRILRVLAAVAQEVSHLNVRLNDINEGPDADVRTTGSGGGDGEDDDADLYDARSRGSAPAADFLESDSDSDSDSHSVSSDEFDAPQPVPATDAGSQPRTSRSESRVRRRSVFRARSLRFAPSYLAEQGPKFLSQEGEEHVVYVLDHVAPFIADFFCVFDTAPHSKLLAEATRLTVPGGSAPMTGGHLPVHQVAPGAQHIQLLQQEKRHREQQRQQRALNARPLAPVESGLMHVNMKELRDIASEIFHGFADLLRSPEHELVLHMSPPRSLRGALSAKDLKNLDRLNFRSRSENILECMERVRFPFAIAIDPDESKLMACRTVLRSSKERSVWFHADSSPDDGFTPKTPGSVSEAVHLQRNESAMSLEELRAMQGGESNWHMQRIPQVQQLFASSLQIQEMSNSHLHSLFKTHLDVIVRAHRLLLERKRQKELEELSALSAGSASMGPGQGGALSCSSLCELFFCPCKAPDTTSEEEEKKLDEEEEDDDEDDPFSSADEAPNGSPPSGLAMSGFHDSQRTVPMRVATFGSAFGGGVSLDSLGSQQYTAQLHKSERVFRHIGEFLRREWGASIRPSKEDNAKSMLLSTMCGLIEKSMAVEDDLSAGTIQRLQHTLSKLGFAELVLRLVINAPPNRVDVVAQALRLGNLLLRDGNPRVQTELHRLFKLPIGEQFFVTLRDRLRHFKQQVKLREEETTKWNLRHDQEEMLLVGNALLFLQLCCEGHNEAMQSLLREQPESDHSVNMVLDTLLLFVVYSSELEEAIRDRSRSLWIKGIRLGVGMLRTLTEYVQGPCKDNQLCLATTKNSYLAIARLLDAVVQRLTYFDDGFAPGVPPASRQHTRSSTQTMNFDTILRSSTNAGLMNRARSLKRKGKGQRKVDLELRCVACLGEIDPQGSRKSDAFQRQGSFQGGQSRTLPGAELPSDGDGDGSGSGSSDSDSSGGERAGASVAPANQSAHRDIASALQRSATSQATSEPDTEGHNVWHDLGWAMMCPNMHLVCTKPNCHRHIRKGEWGCPTCELLKLERAVFEYLLGLMEGNRHVRIFENQLTYLHLPVLMHLLEYHCRDANWNAAATIQEYAAYRLELEKERVARSLKQQKRARVRSLSADSEDAGKDKPQSRAYDDAAEEVSKLMRGVETTKEKIESLELKSLHSENVVLIYAFMTVLQEHPLVAQLPQQLVVKDATLAEKKGSELRIFLESWKLQHSKDKSNLILQAEVVNRDGMLEKVFFKIPQLFQKNTTKWIEPLKNEITEECSTLPSMDERLTRFMQLTDQVVEALEHEEMLSRTNKCRWLVSFIRNREWWKTAYVTALITNLVVIATGQQVDGTTNGEVEYSNPSVSMPLLYTCGAIHTLAAVLMVGEYFVTRGYLRIRQRLSNVAKSDTARRVVEPRGWELQGKGRGGGGGRVDIGAGRVVEEVEEPPAKPSRLAKWLVGDGPVRPGSISDHVQRKGVWFVTKRVVTMPRIVYYFLYLLCTVLAISTSPLFNAFHLVDIVAHSRTLSFVVRAASSRAGQIGATIFLGLVTVYVFSVIGFSLFQGWISTYTFGPDFEAAFDCSTLFDCLQSHVDLGFHSSPVWQTLNSAGEAEPQRVDFVSSLFDFCFFFLVNVILVSVITGIIIDTFSEMRSERDRIDEKIQNSCFICGIDRDVFNLHGQGFKKHVHVEHNMWAYMYLRHYLKIKDELEHNEMTGQESYLQEMFHTSQTAHFPIGKAMSIPERHHYL